MYDRDAVCVNVPGTLDGRLSLLIFFFFEFRFTNTSWSTTSKT